MLVVQALQYLAVEIIEQRGGAVPLYALRGVPETTY